MKRGKQTCEYLKSVRRKVAMENDIPLVERECTHEGDCRGTCPYCEAEVRYLEKELRKRSQLGKAVTVAGIALGSLAMTSCQPQVVGDVENTSQTDSERVENVVTDSLLQNSDEPDKADRDSNGEDWFMHYESLGEIIEGDIEPVSEDVYADKDTAADFPLIHQDDYNSSEIDNEDTL
ncbi:MAG: hypothetical protein IJT51_02620 [Bacteroidales bacterium]|nr:hypothetical protein [Bacteroidales bacterium]